MLHPLPFLRCDFKVLIVPIAQGKRDYFKCYTESLKKNGLCKYLLHRSKMTKGHYFFSSYEK